MLHACIPAPAAKGSGEICFALLAPFELGVCGPFPFQVFICKTMDLALPFFCTE